MAAPTKWKYTWWMLTLTRTDVLGRRRRYQEIYTADRREDLSDIRPLKRGEKLLKISKVTGFSAWAEDVRRRIDQNGVNLALGECAHLLEGGTKIGPALLIQMRRTANPKIRYHLLNVARSIEAGDTLAKAFFKERPICDARLMTIMKVADESGALVAVLKELRKESEYTSFVRWTITSLLIYPYAMCWAFFGVFMVFALKIVHEVARFYAQFKTPLPWYSKGHYAFADLVGQYPYLFCAVMIPLLVALPFLRSRIADMRIMRRHMYAIPRLGSFLVRNEIVVAVSHVAVALQAGLQLPDALKVTNDIFRKPEMAEAWRRIINDINNGVSPEECFEAFAVEFGELGEELASAIRIGAGGREGELKVAMAAFGERLRQDMIQRARDLEKQMSPVITVALMVAAAGLLLPFQVPMFRLGALVAPKVPVHTP